MKLKELGRRRTLWNRAAMFFAVMGPGIITASIDNDAGGITTYTLAGAQFGNLFLWSMIPITAALMIAQEVVTRMGVVTGKGLADLIRENYGVKITFYLMIALVATNLGNVVAEFAGVAAALGIFGIPKALSVGLAAMFVWWLVTQQDYKQAEKVFLIACLFYFLYIVSGYYARPKWLTVLKDTMTPRLNLDRDMLIMLVGLIGSTIAPWMQFYQQSSVVDKGIQARDYRFARLDVLIGCVFTNVVAYFIIVTCSATLFEHGIVVNDAADAARALEPLAGELCAVAFAIGLLVASLAAASILPLSTAYSVCEGLGWQTGMDRRFEEAPQFYTLYSFLIIIGALAVCWPDFPLIKVMYWSQVLNGLLLPFVLVLCLKLSDDPALMGEFVNPPWYRWTAWACVVGVSIASAVMVFGLVAA